MAVEQSIGPLSQIPKGEGRTFEIGGRHIAVIHTRAGGVYAMQADCPHRQGPLADGLVGTDTLVCPLHDRAFDLHTGKGVGNDSCLRVYPARLGDGGAVLVTV